MTIETIREPDLMQSRALELKRSGKTIAVVPTMGALHDGHRALIAEAQRRADVLIVTIFVNPTQFGPNEDLDAYPRSFDADAAVCEAEGADFIFAPTNAAMYPEGYATYVEVERLGSTLCGASRPGHFRGVTTVVTKLFLIAQPNVAVFGWKDAQQFLILRRMVRDLNLPVEMVGVETVREADGLALSSRNRYLDAAQRAQAPALFGALCEARERYERDGVDDAAALKEGIAKRIESNTDADIDYVEIVSTETLQPINRVEPGRTLVALAARLGPARLIDNIRL